MLLDNEKRVKELLRAQEEKWKEFLNAKVDVNDMKVMM